MPRPETRAASTRPTIVCPADSLLTEVHRDQTCVRRDAWEHGEEIRHGPQIDVFRGWQGHFRGHFGQGPAGQSRRARTS